MRTRLLVFLLLLSKPTIAGDDDRSASKRTCNDETYARLVAAKVVACDQNGGVQGCNQNTTCPEIPPRIIALNACIAARRAVMDQCYQGGDSGHKEQVRNLENAVTRCFKYLERCKRDDESCKE
jgi:hypothetical protein